MFQKRGVEDVFVDRVPLPLLVSFPKASLKPFCPAAGASVEKETAARRSSWPRKVVGNLSNVEWMPPCFS